MNKKEQEYLDRIALADSRFVDNKEWLEMMDTKYKVGQPSAIWCEAVLLADTLMSVVIGKNIVFAKWGNRTKEMPLYAVKKMAVYILEHPIGERNDIDYAELESIRNTIRLQEEKLMKSENNRYVITEDEPYEMSRGMVAECIAIAYVKKKAIKGIIKELIKFSKPFSTGLFTCMLPLIAYYNNELDNFLHEEYCQVLDIVNKRKAEYTEMNEKLEKGVGLFSEEQVKHIGISKDKNLWLDMMKFSISKKEKYGDNVEDEDFVVGFLAALRNAGEFTNKSGYDNFFGMMSELYSVDLEKNEKNRVKRYVQDNGDNYLLWSDTPEKRRIRKKIACDVVGLMKKKKKDLGLE